MNEDVKTTKTKTGIKRTWPYHLFLLPGMIILVIYTYLPFLGNIMAFQKFKPLRGFFRSEWVGLANFKRMFSMPETMRVFRNSLIISFGKLVLTLLLSIVFAILLHECTLKKYKKTVQTICFLPHFLSWIILATVFRSVLDKSGIINQLLINAGILENGIAWLGSRTYFRGILIGTDVWKEFGYGAIIFMAALTGISPELYEAAEIDGAGRLARIRHVTVPGISITIAMVATLNVGSILNAGFDQVFNLYSPVVYETGDIIDTYVYRMSFINTQYSLASAIGLLKSLISFALVPVTHWAASKYAGYRLF